MITNKKDISNFYHQANSLIQLNGQHIVLEHFNSNKENIDCIFDTILHEQLDLDIRDLMVSKIIELSPKKAGLFFEVFSSQYHNLTKPNNIYHDALNSANERYEMKASRAFNTTENENCFNLWDELMNTQRQLVSFKDSLIMNYECNIQQVKPSEFEYLHYCIFFRDVIIEFEVHSNDLKCKRTEEIFSEFKSSLQRSEDTVSKRIYNELRLLDDISTYSYDKALKLLSEPFVKHNRLDTLYSSDLILELYKKSQLGFSNKQHKGNSGEGQFHISRKNIIYHLTNNFKRSYSYYDFAQVLQERLKNGQPTTSNEKRSFTTI